MILKNIFDLEPHPLIETIYGNKKSNDELKRKILDSGIVTTLIINHKNQIISGRRRWEVCKQLLNEGYTQFQNVCCKIKEYNEEADIVMEMISSNRARDRTKEQRAREVYAVFSAEKKRTKAPNREVAKSILDKVSASSYTEIEIMVYIIENIDALIEKAEYSQADFLSKVLNIAPYSATKSIIPVLDKLTLSDKDDILHGRIKIKRLIELVKERPALSIKKINKQSGGDIKQNEAADQLRDYDRDTSASPLQISLMFKGAVDNVATTFMLMEQERNFDVVDAESKSIYVETIKKLMDMINVIENKY